MSRMFLSLSLGLVFVAGCGGSSGPTKYEIHGKVTLNGQPVSAGNLTFEPDGKQGNAGPPASTIVKDGAYAIPADKGIIGGPHLVRLTPPMLESGSTVPPGSQFRPQTINIMLPKADSEQNLKFEDVPVSGGR